MDWRFAVNPCWFLHATLPGRAPQGRGSRSGREGKAASGGPAAYTESYMPSVARPFVAVYNPARKSAPRPQKQKQQKRKGGCRWTGGVH